MATSLSHDALASLLMRAARSSQCLATGRVPFTSQVQKASLIQLQLQRPTRRYASNSSKKEVAKPQAAPVPTHSRLSQIPLPTGAKAEDFVPQPLSRPVGLSYPPETSQNTGLDERTLRQRRADFINIERHIARRKELKSEFSRPYFREWTMMKHAKGKSFIANERLFRGEKAGWFPNVWGETLLKKGGNNWLPKLGWNTTHVFQDKVNVVAVFSGLWAENQVKTFVDNNKELMNMLENENQGLLQLTRINIEESWVRRSIVKMFKWRLRKDMKEEEWGRYFIVNKSLSSNEVRDAIGFLNGKVGYVYLLDNHCRIRWAGSGNAEPGEIASLNAGVKRLLEETKKEAK